MLAKICRANVEYMVEFQADVRVGFGKCIHFFKSWESAWIIIREKSLCQEW